MARLTREDFLGRVSSGINNYALDLYKVYGLAYHCEGNHFVELGVGAGNSTYALLYATQQKNGTLYGIDIDAGYEEPFKDQYCRKFIHGSSQDSLIVDQIINVFGTIDLLLLDTTHQKKDTEIELELWLPKVSGLVLLHDTKSFPDGVKVPAQYYALHNPPWVFTEIGESKNGLGLMFKVEYEKINYSDEA